MKFQTFILLLFTASILFCKSIPLLEHSDNTSNKTDNIFLKEKYRLTHSIKAKIPFNGTMLAIGVTVADPSEDSIDVVLMSVEGLVLFDAGYKKNLFQINRAVPPFDKDDFGRGMIDDIRLFYFSPESGKTESGKIDDEYVTRFNFDDSGVTDVITAKDGKTIINKYNSEHDLIRIVNIIAVNDEGIPEKIELITPGFFGYSLYLELVDAEKI